MIILYIVLGLAAALLIGMTCASVYLVKTSFTRNVHTEEEHRNYLSHMRENGNSDWADRMEQGEAAFDAAEKENVWITSFDGLRLHAYLLGGEENVGRTAILVHGYRSRGKYDYARLWQYYRSRGWRVLVIDQRAHGESEGDHICFGVKERFDLKDWVKYISGRYTEKEMILLHGISMGAATVMMVQALPEVNSRICAFVADCGYVSPGQEFRHNFRQRRLPYFPMFAIANVVTRVMCGFWFYEASADKALTQARRPALFIHGLEDDFVPVESSRINYAACASEKDLFLVPGATHATAVYTDEAGYYAHLDDLLAKC